MGSPRVERDPASAARKPVRSPAAKKVTGGKGVTRALTAARNGPGAPLDEAPTGDADAVGAPASKRVLRSQGRRTMRKLLDAAMVAFDKRGYHATRVNDVVEIARTSHGTFYLYFSNKEDLLRALVAEAAADSKKVYESFSTLPDPGGLSRWEDVRGWVQAYSDLWTRYAPLFRVWAELVTVDRELGRTIRHTF